MTPLVLAALLWRAPVPLTVAHGETRSVSAPAIDGPARLAFRVRADYPRFAGSNLFLRVLVNGTAVGSMRDRRTARLAGEARLDGLPRFDLGRWRVAYGPVPRARDELVLDVSDLVDGRGPNVLTFEHGPASSAGATPLVVDRLRLERAPGALPAAAPAPPPDWTTPRLGFPAPPAFAARSEPGAVVVGWGGESVAVRTSVRGGAHGWERQLALTPTHVEVRDTVRNPSGARIGLRVRHAIATAAPWVHLGGRAEPDVQDAYDPWNPTVFTPVAAGGIGLVAEDDVFRQQVRVDFEAASGTVGLRTDMLCLGPGESRTLVWSVYPTRTPSYWDFVSTLRADWGVDRTIPGGYVWFAPDDVLALPAGELARGLAHVAIASMWGGWRDPARAGRPQPIGFGTAVLGPDFAALRERIRAAVAKLKAARPGLRVLLYFDAQRDSVHDAPRRYADSLLVPLEETDWGGRFSPSWSMVPTAANSFGRAMAPVAAAMRELGADGLYWDEMDGIEYGAPRVTTALSDGASCALDEAGRVVRPLGLVNVLSDEVKLGWAGDGLVLGNTPPTTRRFQVRRDIRMVEAQHGPAWAAFAHLATPLGYLGARRDWAAVVEQVEAGLLVAATRLDYPYDPPRMFPFTPEYLQPGTLRGRERIVTVRGGTHGWLAGGGEVRAFHYDASGRESVARWHGKRRGDARLVRVRLAPGELAVIERAHAAPAH